MSVMHIIRIRYAYLPVFLMMRFVIWPISTKRIGGVVPVHARQSGKMEIPNLESELVYLPMKYTKGNYYPSGFPFWFAGGEINTFLPDWEKTVKVRLYRNIRYMVGCAAYGPCGGRYF